MFKPLLHSALAAASLAVAAWSAPAAAQPATAAQAPSLRVTYLIYSGRPNPSLLIRAPEQVRSIQSQLGTALATGAPVKAGDAPSALGYNGVLIEPVSGDGPQYVVRDSLLRADAPAGSRAAAAPTLARSAVASQLEAQLLNLGRREGALDAATLNFMKSAGAPSIK